MRPRSVTRAQWESRARDGANHQPRARLDKRRRPGHGHTVDNRTIMDETTTTTRRCCTLARHAAHSSSATLLALPVLPPSYSIRPLPSLGCVELRVTGLGPTTPRPYPMDRLVETEQYQQQSARSIVDPAVHQHDGGKMKRGGTWKIGS